VWTGPQRERRGGGLEGTQPAALRRDDVHHPGRRWLDCRRDLPRLRVNRVSALLGLAALRLVDSFQAPAEPLLLIVGAAQARRVHRSRTARERAQPGVHGGCNRTSACDRRSGWRRARPSRSHSRTGSAMSHVCSGWVRAPARAAVRTARPSSHGDAQLSASPSRARAPATISRRTGVLRSRSQDDRGRCCASLWLSATRPCQHATCGSPRQRSRASKASPRRRRPRRPTGARQPRSQRSTSKSGPVQCSRTGGSSQPDTTPRTLAAFRCASRERAAHG